LLTIKSNMDSGHFQPIYEAGITALETSDHWIKERNRIYQTRRDYILNRLNDIGLSAAKSKGSLYIWAKPEQMSAIEYVEGALTQAYVSIAPGKAYGPGGENYVRISLGLPDNRIKQALDRLTEWYSHHG